MPGTTIPRGDVRGIDVASVTLSPTSVANATSAEQTFAVKGLAANDFVTVLKPTTQAGLGIVNARVSAADTLAITFMNCTAATITPTASEAYLVMRFRSEYPTLLGYL